MMNKEVVYLLFFSALSLNGMELPLDRPGENDKSEELQLTRDSLVAPVTYGSARGHDDEVIVDLTRDKSEASNSLRLSRSDNQERSHSPSYSLRYSSNGELESVKGEEVNIDKDLLGLTDADYDEIVLGLNLHERGFHVPEHVHAKHVREVLEHHNNNNPHELLRTLHVLRRRKTAPQGVPSDRDLVPAVSVVKRGKMSSEQKRVIDVSPSSDDIDRVSNFLARKIITKDCEFLGHTITEKKAQLITSGCFSVLIYSVLVAVNLYLAYGLNGGC